MARFGLVEQAEDSREYRLGPAALRLAALREAHVPMREATRPVLARLSDATGESAHTSMMIGDRLQLLDFVHSSRHGTRVMLDDADTLPFHATSSGLAVLAFLPDAVRERVLAGPLPAVTSQTETDAARLRIMVESVRRQGFAIAEGSFELDVTGMAAPLFGPRGDCLGAVAVAAPGARVTPALRDLILRDLTAAASEIVALWGGAVPPELASLWKNAA
jgi:DNA-binding IclR family transcriptional regulator